ncbi:MAG: ribulose-phosphate 3-epimerase [Actinobacteria bacterium]|nr:ribulose-phosphate 3-epimerase [Actinomycetota bacterium]MCL5772158.1 ribulose-phosphate 3-epimerase [Actinomycetota bacterium]
MVKKYASLLSADASDYKKIIRDLEQRGFTGFHFDIMDGHFVKNFAFNATIIKSLRKLTKLPFQAHLEIENPGEYIDMFIDSGCQIITVHPQTCNLERELRYIRTKNALASVAIDPELEIDVIKRYMSLIDNIVVMSVYPGFGNQKFNEKSLKKIKNIKRIIEENDLEITVSVDGGIDSKTEYLAIENGTDILIFGSSLFE